MQNIIDGEVNDFNKEKKYNEKFKDVAKSLGNRTKDSNDIILYNHYHNYLKRILYSTRKLYDNKQITKQLHNILNKALRQSPQHL